MDTNIHKAAPLTVIPAKAGIQYRGYENSYLSNGALAVLMTTVLDARLRGHDNIHFETDF